MTGQLKPAPRRTDPYRLVADDLLDPDHVAARIGIALDDWPGNCHGIASAVRDVLAVSGVPDAWVERGHYRGDVHPSSIFAGRGLIAHSWVGLPNGRVYDPTRWAFDRPSRPSIYLGGHGSRLCACTMFDGDDETCDCGHDESEHADSFMAGCTVGPDYDPGGNISRRDRADDPPPAEQLLAAAPVAGDLSDTTRRLIDRYCRPVSPDAPTVAAMHHLANLSLYDLGLDACRVYDDLDRVGMRASVPIDNWDIAHQGGVRLDPFVMP